MDEKSFVEAFDDQIDSFSEVLKTLFLMIKKIHEREKYPYLPFYTTRKLLVHIYTRIKEFRRRLRSIRRFRRLSYKLPFRVIIFILSFYSFKVDKKTTVLDFYGYFSLDHTRSIFLLWEQHSILYEARKNSPFVLPLRRLEFDLFSIGESIDDEKKIKYISKISGIEKLNIPNIKNKPITQTLYNFIPTVRKIFISDSDKKLETTFQFLRRFQNLEFLSIGSYYHTSSTLTTDDENEDNSSKGYYNLGLSLPKLKLLRFSGGVPNKFRFEDLKQLRSIEMYSCMDLTNRHSFEISLLPSLVTFSWDNSFLYRASSSCNIDVFQILMNPNLRRFYVDEVDYEIHNNKQNFFSSKIENNNYYCETELEEFDWSGGTIPVSLVTKFISKVHKSLKQLTFRVNHHLVFEEHNTTFGELVSSIGSNLPKLQFLSITLSGEENNQSSEPDSQNSYHYYYFRSTDFPCLKKLCVFGTDHGPFFSLDAGLRLKKLKIKNNFRLKKNENNEMITPLISSIKKMGTLRSFTVVRGDITIGEFNQLISMKSLRSLKIGYIFDQKEEEDNIQIDELNTRLRKVTINSFGKKFFVSLINALLPPPPEQKNVIMRRKIHQSLELLHLQSIPRGVSELLQNFFVNMPLFYPFLTLSVSNYFVKKDKYEFFETESRILNSRGKSFDDDGDHLHKDNNLTFLKNSFDELEKQIEEVGKMKKYVLRELQKSLHTISKKISSLNEVISFHGLPRTVIRKILFEFVFFHPPRRYISCIFGYFGDDDENNGSINTYKQKKQFFQVFGNLLLQSVNLFRKLSSNQPITFMRNGVVMNEVHFKNIEVFSDLVTIGRIRKIFCHNSTVISPVEFFDFQSVEHLIFRNCLFSHKNRTSSSQEEEEEEGEIICSDEGRNFIDHMFRIKGSKFSKLRVVTFDQCRLSKFDLEVILEHLSSLIRSNPNFEKIKIFQGRVDMKLIEEIKSKYNNLVLFKKGIKKGQRKHYINLFRRRRRKK